MIWKPITHEEAIVHDFRKKYKYAYEKVLFIKFIMIFIFK
ncbi:hypothetical protein SAMN05660493_01407 [Epilithonimonas bovis DSM 19482]|uniref:Uncharacterized protein n=1 Tax=Epilithonimonas bovis DSM 19482 TaxID=1121284 RepID=A0A1U7PW39_9FLAO|nr:hypothetical protein SAMN05660493_01407 [Epilithonimonas bovis DSM 19482]